MTSVFVHVTTDVERQQLDEDDLSVAGIYEVSLADETPKDGRADAALDGFHRSVGIAMVDDFHITVHESTNPKSALIVQSDLYEHGALAVHASHVEKLPQPFQILASFQPQAWINDNAVDIDGAQDVDVTQDVLRLAKDDLDQLHSLRDYRESSDALVEKHVQAVNHNGPFSVEVVDAVTKAFGVENLGDITEAMVEEATTRAAPESKSAPRPG